MRMPRIHPFVVDIGLAAILTFMGLVTALPFPPAPEGSSTLDLVTHWTPVALLVVTSVGRPGRVGCVGWPGPPHFVRGMITEFTVTE